MSTPANGITRPGEPGSLPSVLQTSYLSRPGGRIGYDVAGDGPLVVLVPRMGDLRASLEAGHVPGVGSRRHLRDATAMINQMRQRYPDLAILPAHDPGAAARLAQATGQAPTLATA